jgi:PleD family two-component response regulator
MAEQHREVPVVLGTADFRRMLAWEVQRATRYQDFLSLLLVRLAGPPAARTIIRNLVARKLVEILRSSDVVGMVEEDLAVILVHTSDTDALAITERLQPVLRDFVLSEPTGGGATVQLSLVAFPGDATIDDALLARALARLPRLS